MRATGFCLSKGRRAGMRRQEPRGTSFVGRIPEEGDGRKEGDHKIVVWGLVLALSGGGTPAGRIGRFSGGIHRGWRLEVLEPQRGTRLAAEP